MYGDAKTADNPSDAGALMKSLMGNPTGMQAKFNAAKDQLSKHATVDPKRIGASGYCMGGSVVLNMARVGADLNGFAGFHAGLGPHTPAAQGKVQAKVLGQTSAYNPVIKPTTDEAFRED